ncbi:disks large-associated protein 5 isoform X1 [Triplophysa rosa]|uniref:disks large-associated protein 5 isoform X1 n=1 Tax=Triplophysa rosa TaxID=992332 RepID=UPI0025461C40|nr:disks large-associated protein 5 isoform X1 [Triplophysa rosa]
MDSRFAHLYKRDSSVSMIRLKMSRRRSQSQKENREKMQNLRRHMDQLPEIELSMDASSIIHTQGDASKTKAFKAEERKKMLARYKENKMLQKDKEKREKEKKGVFKVGLYKPQPLGYLPSNSAGTGRGKMITEPNQSTRVTRSMMQNQKPAVVRQAAPKKVEMAPPSRAQTKKNSKPLASTKGRIATDEPVRAPTTRSSAKVKPAPVAKPVADSRAPKTRSTVKCPAAPSTCEEKALQGDTKPNAGNKVENKPAEKETSVDSVSAKRDEEPKATPSSFAPQGFVFQPPDGLTSFQPEPLSPRSAISFPSPSFVFEANMEATFPSPKALLPAPSVSSPPPSLSTPPPDHLSNPLPASSPPVPSSPQSSTPAAASPPSVPLEPQHDVAYFRAVMASETERLTGLSELWKSRFDDTSIPEETRDLMRTAVGQARLLMKERFGQFSGLVDDCDLGRGEKITTCTDLQGFWDMVYFQVEDVNKKLIALKEAEARDWKEEVRPAARKRVVKKPPVAGAKTTAGGGASAAAKSRLAAVKAAMRAKHAERKAAETSDNNQDASSSAPATSADTLPVQTVVFHGGFFQVESPVKPSGLVGRSSRISAVSTPQCSKFTTPSRQGRPNAASHASPLPCTPSRNLSDVLPISTPQHPAEPLPQTPKAPQISPEHNQSVHVSPDTESCSNNLPQFDLSPKTCTSHIQSDSSSAQENGLADQSLDAPSQSETELPVDSSEPCPELAEHIAESVVCSPSSQENTEENLISDEEIPTGAEACSGTKEVKTDPSVCGPASTTLTPSTPAKDLEVSTALNNEVVISACDSSPSSTDVEMTGNQDCEGDAGLDIEHYLQPSVRYSMSPVQRLTEERFSLGAVDAEMESPASQVEEHTVDVLETPTALPRMLFTPRTDQMSDNLLLFTPEKRERERQSVCEHDLMTFTPPTNK